MISKDTTKKSKRLKFLANTNLLIALNIGLLKKLTNFILYPKINRNYKIKKALNNEQFNAISNFYNMSTKETCLITASLLGKSKK